MSIVKLITMKNIVLYGAPGAGKGTQAALLAEKFDLIHLSTGEMLRREVAIESPVGIRVKDIMNRGDLVGDDIVVALIAKALDHGRNELLDEWDELRLRRACGIGPDDPLPEKPQPSILYDGFPRTVQQCQMLEFLSSKSIVGLMQSFPLMCRMMSWCVVFTSVPSLPTAATIPRRSSGTGCRNTRPKRDLYLTTTKCRADSSPSTAVAKYQRPTHACVRLWNI